MLFLVHLEYWLFQFSSRCTSMWWSFGNIIMWRNGVQKCFSNYGPWTTCGPRGLPLWSFNKVKRNNNITINCTSHYSWKSQSLEMTHGNRLSLFVPVLTFYEIYYPTHLPIAHSTFSNKQGFKALWTWCIPYTSGASSVAQAGTSWIHNRAPKYWNFPRINDIVNSFAYSHMC